MATVSSTGTTIDVASLVSSLMEVERQPLYRLQSKESTLQSKISSLGQIQSQLSALKDAASALASVTTYKAAKVSATGTGATAAVTGSPVTATYQVKVSALARAQSSATLAVDPAADLGSGTLSITQGSTTVDIATGGEGQPAKLADLRDAINSHTELGVSATLVSAGGTSRLLLSSKQTGVANGFSVSGTGALASLGFATQQDAADASFTLNGLSMSSATNTIADAVDGLSLVLAAEPPAGSAPGTTVDATITVASDPDAVKTKLKDLVNAYNTANSNIRSKTSYDATTKVAGQLNGESVLRQAQSTISAVLRGSVTPAVEGDFTRLADIGLQFQRDGSLSLDESRFDAAMKADPAKVQRLLSQTGTDSSQGLAARLRSQLDLISGTAGSLYTRQEGLRSQIRQLDARQAEMETRLTTIESRLRIQYSKLDALMSDRQTTSDALYNSLAGLY